MLCEISIELLHVFQTIKQLEKELMKGQSFQGPLIAREIYTMLEKKNMTDK